MIRVTCPHCGTNLKSRDDLVGETRRCPNCTEPFVVVPDPPPASGEVAAAPPSDDPPATPAAEEGLPSLDLPEHLNRESHYLICDRTHLVAVWQNDGRGWLLKTSSGFVPAKRNREKLPAEGDFKLVELKLTATPDGRRLAGIASYQLALRWALIVLDQSDEAIIGKIVGHGSLNQDQKSVVRQVLGDQFMREVWQDAADVLAYLANADYHSSGVG
jgi:hypothetical protein